MSIIVQMSIQKLLKVPIDILTAGIGIVVLLGFYGMLNAIHAPGRYIAWIVVLLLITTNLLACLFGFIWNDSPFSNNGLLGVIAFLVAVYAVSQWLVRRWYLWIKRYGRSLLVKATQNILLFLRKYHQLFGWLVLAAATGHALSYGPAFTRMKASDAVTGVLSWIILAVLVFWGYWLERRTKKKLAAKPQRLIHTGIALIFFLFLIFHI